MTQYDMAVIEYDGIIVTYDVMNRFERKLLKDFLDKVDSSCIDKEKCMVVNFTREYLTKLIGKTQGEFDAKTDLELIENALDVYVVIEDERGDVDKVKIAERLYYGDDVGLHMLSSQSFTELIEAKPEVANKIKEAIDC